MNKEESLNLLENWINYLRQSVPNMGVYWEERVMNGELMGEEIYWPKFHTDHQGLNKKGFFASQDMAYAGYIDPKNPENSYFLHTSSLIINFSVDYRGYIPEIRGLKGNSAWTKSNQYKINPDGTYTYVWGGKPLYDITSLVLRHKSYFKFLNWSKENPLEVKE